MSEDLLNTQCFIPINEDRRICYTSADRSRWGYCDCSLDSQWSRPFGKWEVLHNSKFRESDVILLTDDLHAPLDGIACSNGRNDGQEDAGFHCKFRANTTLCLQSEKYGEWHEWYGFDVSKNFYETEKTTGWYAEEVLKEMHPESMIEVVCDIGEVLTGIAVTEKPSHGLVPRCGVPASTWEVDTDCIYDTRDMSSMNNTLNATRCHYSSIKYYRSESDADYTPCPDGEVAIGFWNAKDLTYDQWRAETSANDVYDNMERKNEHVDRSRAAYAGAPVRSGICDYAWSSGGRRNYAHCSMLELLRTMSRYAKFLIRHAHLLNATVDLKPLRVKNSLSECGDRCTNSTCRAVEFKLSGEYVYCIRGLFRIRQIW